MNYKVCVPYHGAKVSIPFSSKTYASVSHPFAVYDLTECIGIPNMYVNFL